MPYRRSDILSVAGPAIVALLYFGAATISLRLTQGVDGIATIWPASGIPLASLLLLPRAVLPSVLAGAGIASFAANWLAGIGVGEALGLSLVNIGESALAWWMLCGHGERTPSFQAPADIGRFAVATVAAAAGSASAASVVVALSGAFTGVQFTASWFLTDLLGMLIITPMVLTGVAAMRARGQDPDLAVRWRDVVMVLTLVAAVTGMVFAQSRYPLLFLPLVALLAATYRLGTFGATGGVVLIATIGTGLTAMGHGPLMLLAGAAGMKPLFLQFYLLVLLGASLPKAALLATRNRLMRQVAENNRLLRLAERTAQLGHWRMDAVAGTLFWSPEVFRLHGRTESVAPPLDEAIDAYHPDDRARVRAYVTAALAGEGGGDFRFDARLVCPDGTIRHVVSRGMADRAANGTLIGLFGVIQDVTERVSAVAALEAARMAAETAADTDQLTGIASRRAALRLLDVAIADAVRSGRALSVAIFDVDHFKAVNDRFGHLVGDRVLQRVACAAAQALRHDDLVGRLGGEEFVLLLPGADADAATVVAERVRMAIATGGSADAADDPSVTISIGVALLDADVSATMLLNRADRALYDAKRSGRNRMRIAA